MPERTRCRCADAHSRLVPVTPRSPVHLAAVLADGREPAAAVAGRALGALANARDIDVVLSDVMMPGGVNGLQLAREIRRRDPTLRILLTTGYVEALAGMATGEFDVLLKPYTAESLASALGIEPAETASVQRGG